MIEYRADLLDVCSSMGLCVLNGLRPSRVCDRNVNFDDS